RRPGHSDHGLPRIDPGRRPGGPRRGQGPAHGPRRGRLRRALPPRPPGGDARRLGRAGAPRGEEVIAASSVAPPDPDELLVVVGPTASGKTDLAVLLCERFGGEVISADSVQVYRGFDVGSGKPTAADRARAPHHLVDVADPLEPFDAKRFAELADQAIA